jgi:hypothetical protein
MGISTTGFVLTENKDVFAVLSTIEITLTELIRKYAKDQFIFRDSTSKLPELEYVPRTKSFYICFKVNNENRMLSVHFDCDSDYSEYGDSKIIWSVNYWGMAEEIMLGICKAMKQYGKVFYKADDFDGSFIEV